MLVQSFSGVRGIYKKDLDENTARKYCQAYLQFLQKDKVVIGCDTRPSSQSLKKAMISVIPDAIDVGIATTPMISLAVRDYNADGGIIITASHNEPEYNGWKFLAKDSALLRPDDIEKVIDNFKKNNLRPCKNEKTEDKNGDIKKDYINFVLNLIKEDIELIRSSNFTIVTDPNGGPAILILDELLKKLNIKNIKKNYELGKFSRLVEPNEQSLKYLVPIINENNADFAVGFDCDADRVEIMTKNEVISGNYILALLVDEVLSFRKGLVVTNDVTSYVVRDIALRYNCKVKEVETGEVNVVDEMIKSKSVVGGEGSSSGGIFPPSRVRDGILTTAIILRLLAKRKESINSIINSYPRYYAERINVKTDKDIIKIKEELKEYFLKKYRIQETGDSSGGLKILISKNSFLWFRPSKTEQGILRIISDSNDKEEAKSLVELGKEAFDSIVGYYHY